MKNCISNMVDCILAPVARFTAVILVLSLALPGNVWAQRRLPGQKGLQATVGVVDGFGKRSIHTGITLSRFTKNSNQWAYGVEYLRKKLPYNNRQLVPVEQFTGEGGFHWTFLSDPGKTVFFSAGISAMAGYELVNRDKLLLYDGASILSESRFLFGGALSFEVETYIVDRIILLTGIKERILPSSTINTSHFQISIGLKFIIN